MARYSRIPKVEMEQAYTTTENGNMEMKNKSECVREREMN